LQNQIEFLAFVFRRSCLSPTRIEKKWEKRNAPQSAGVTSYWCTTTVGKKNRKTIEQRQRTHSLHYYRPSLVPREPSTAVLTLCCMHVDGAPPARRTPKLPPPTLALAATMTTTSNSQLHKPTSRPQVTTKRSKPPQWAYWLRKQNIRSAHSQLWFHHGPPSSTSASTYSRSTEAPLINTTMTLKPQKINTEDDNPSKDRTILEERTHENTRWVRLVRGASENETRRGRRGEEDEFKWRCSFYSTHPLRVVNATWCY
jgi:hypothetical protein